MEIEIFNNSVYVISIFIINTTLLLLKSLKNICYNDIFLFSHRRNIPMLVSLFIIIIFQQL